MSRGSAVLVENTRQARKVRWLCWASAAWAAGWLWWAAEMAQSYGLSPGDGGALRSAVERWGVAVLLAAVGVLPLAGMALYARRYIVRLVRSGESAEVTVAGFWRPYARSYPAAAFAPGRAHHGRLSTGGVSVNAPWITLRVDGRRYFVDLQAERVDRKALERLAGV